MSTVYNYKGSIVNLLFSAIENNPELTFGQVLHSIISKNALKKNYLEATDEEIYTSTENFVKFKETYDEPMSDEEFNNWVNNK